MQRYYICPVVGVGSDADPQRPKVANYSTAVNPINVSAAILTDALGKPARTWCLARVQGADLSAIDADAQCVDILEKLPDAAGDTRAEIVAWLKSKTVADVPPPARSRINARLVDAGVDTSGITLATTLFQVVVLLFRQHEPVNALEDL